MADELDALGTAYAEFNQLDKAVEAKLRAVKAMEYLVLHHEEDEIDSDVSCTRETLAKIYEKKGNLDEARKMRLRGLVVGGILCARKVSLSLPQLFRPGSILTSHYRGAMSLNPEPQLWWAVCVVLSFTAAFPAVTLTSAQDTVSSAQTP